MKKFLSFLLVTTHFLVGMQPAEKQRADKKSFSKLFSAIQKDYTQELTQLLDTIEFTRTQKVEALLNAITQKKKNAVAILLHQQVNVNGINTRQIPLLEAVLGRQQTFVEWLLIFGADPSRRSTLSNFNDIPTVLECEASDSDICYITPLALAQARISGRNTTPLDRRIFNMLSRQSEYWHDESLKEKIMVTTNSCIEAIKHSDTDALIYYLDHCTLHNKRKQYYLDERFTIAARMCNEKAMRLLIQAGAEAAPALQEFATSFSTKPIKACLLHQYVNNQEIKEAQETAEAREHDVNFIPSVNKFQLKKQKTVALLSNSRTLMLEGVTKKRRNIVTSIRNRELGTK